MSVFLTAMTVHNLISLIVANYVFVDLPAGYDSDDEYISEEEEKDDNIFAPIHQPPRMPQGVQLQPPPMRQDVSKQTSAKDTSKDSAPAGFQWTRNTCALRAPGTDPAKLRKEFVSASASTNVVGKESGVRSPAMLASSEQATSLDDSAPFGVPRRRHAKAQADTANWAWVEQVLKLKSQELRAPQGSLEV